MFTSFLRSSMPDDVLAHPEYRSQLLQMSTSVTASASTSPRATAVPNAEAAREYAIEAYLRGAILCRAYEHSNLLLSLMTRQQKTSIS